MGFLDFYKTVWRFSSIKVKVAIFEAVVVTISSVVALIPWEKTGVEWDDVTLIFTPILCLMVSNNVSSFTNIHITITMLLGTLIGSLYCYIIELITKDIIWITFITTFIMFYVVAALSNIPNRRWMTGLFLKKMFLDIFINLYFTRLSFLEIGIMENIYCVLFILGALLIGSVLFPMLASRLIFGKVIKTMRSTRVYFLLLGNHLEENLYRLGNDNGNSKFEIGGNTKNQLIKEQQSKQDESFSKPVLNISVQRSLSVQDAPIGVTPLLNSQNREPQTFHEEKLKLPLSRSRANDRSSVSVDIGNHRTKSKKNEVNNSSAVPPRKKSILSTPSFNKKVKIIKTLGLEKTDEEMQILEVELSTRINTMTCLYVESKNERWNDELNENYDELISKFEMTLKQLISIKNSIKSGFSQISSDELIAPLVPFIECLVEEVYLQMGIMADILNYNSEDLKDGAAFKLLSKSFDETQELIDRVKGAFKNVVDAYQHGEHPLLSYDEVTKVHFFVHGILSFALQQREFADILIKVKKLQRSHSVRWELIRYGLLYVISGFPLMLVKRLKFLKRKFFGSSSPSSDTKSESKENNFVALFKWIYFHFFKNGKWRFPLQVSFGLISTIIPFYYFDGRTDPSGTFVTYGVWTVTTILFVMGPSLGASISKGYEESKGTIAGAIVGFLASLLCSVIPTPYKEIVISVLIFAFTFIISFPHQHLPNAQAAEICELTFLLLLLGQNLTQKFEYMYVVLRALHIFMGVVWNAIVCMVVFPYFSYKATRIKMFQITNLMSDSFINILISGLRMSESINGQDLQTFSSHGDEQSIGKRQDAIKKILMEHKDDLIIKNNADNINNIIRLQDIGSIESIRYMRDKKKEQIYESLKEIRIGIDQIRESLVDVKSEMYFVSPSKTAFYYSIAENLDECSITLFALENSFDPIFSDLLILSMFDLVKPLNDLFQQLIKSKSDIKLMMAGKFNGDLSQHCGLVKEKWDAFQHQFKSIRAFLLNEKMFHILHPEQIQFGSGIHSIEMFIHTFIKLLEDLRSIKNETSYLKQFLRLK
ncbi:hypothetical protein DICPUDRAFT_35206 [Dictyostelium purpureum]|uniref:DUF2421 domain-containing protein n=1 Tax=Dictyostelium purpureum TaxID=5786 RepID=F0ZP15_DICPU|nr:uncharacterized protein DICPUDRAFT_35206 [Dictyostelium purpureum]EGC34318.1 hypothetical protein DICPUDRAFT_35206 [Dictyostelium purpureum]|eukprot:XP_003289154.1 hypothetical protein DICPUDRAFT_35206 [Dictyostelium purpureum]